MDRQIYDKSYYEGHKKTKRFNRWQKKISKPKGYLLWQFQSIYNRCKSKGKTLPFSRVEFLAKFLADGLFLNLHKTYLEKGRLKYLEPKILRVSIQKGYSLSNLRATSRSYDHPSVSKVSLESVPLKSESVDFEKYTKNIISQITKKATEWLVPCASENEIWAYLRDSGLWIGLFNQWVRSQCENYLQPKIDRNKKRNGFVLENLMLMADRDYKNRIERQKKWKWEQRGKSTTSLIEELNKNFSNSLGQTSKIDGCDLPGPKNPINAPGAPSPLSLTNGRRLSPFPY